MFRISGAQAVFDWREKINEAKKQKTGVTSGSMRDGVCANLLTAPIGSLPSCKLCTTNLNAKQRLAQSRTAGTLHYYY